MQIGKRMKGRPRKKITLILARIYILMDQKLKSKLNRKLMIL